ncbi:MAG: acyl-CoA dehydrogenase family protein [Bacteroidota bacterium]
MATNTKAPKHITGGTFIIKDTDPQSIFISESLSEEQRMIRESIVDFIEQEIDPVSELLDSQKDLSLAPHLLEKTGELGMLGIGVPESYGGIEMDFVTALSNSESMSGAHSFALTIGVQTSIGIAPILLYGNEAQKQQYLPQMITGELKSCYCLTEPDAGSDANSGKTTAQLNEAGTHYILNGQKMWITNSGFADLFIVFAKIDGDKNLSAFIVEKAFGGVTLGEEEKKMGIKGSSTRQVFFNEVPVPIDNLLGERQGGFKIALNVLNTGRIKLSASCLGSSKRALGLASRYANERKQFGTPISSFGAIKEKLAKIATRTYGLDAALYRTGAAIDQAYDEMIAAGLDANIAKSACVEAYAIECAILKVYGSETEALAVDEGVQIHGGMGFSADTKIEKMYRDARISRIFEGTNEINRMLSIDMLLKKAMGGQLDLLGAVQKVMGELSSLPEQENPYKGPLSEAKCLLAGLKKAFLLLAGSAVQKLMMKLKEEQEILINAADILAQIYILESAILKTEQLISLKGEISCEDQIRLTQLLAHDSVSVVRNAGEEIIYGFASEDEISFLLMGLKRYTKISPLNRKAERRLIAERLSEKAEWCF